MSTSNVENERDPFDRFGVVGRSRPSSRSRFHYIHSSEKPYWPGGRPANSLEPTTGSLRIDCTRADDRTGVPRSFAPTFRPVAVALNIQKRIGWHTFRHTYSTLLRSVGAEFKVTQELMRHSTLRTTMDVYRRQSHPPSMPRKLQCWRCSFRLLTPQTMIPSLA